jgi:two-component system response regulator DegU
VKKRLRVLIIDDEERIRRVIERVISSASDMEVAGQADNGEEGLKAVFMYKPDVVLLDIEMPKMDGLEFLEKFSSHNAHSKVIVLTSHDEQDTVVEAIKRGALGYLLKTSTPDEVLNAIRRVADGEAILSPSIAIHIIKELREGKSAAKRGGDKTYKLSKREWDILDLVAAGMRNKEIAEKLNLAEKTIKNHVTQILRVMEVGSRTEAAMKAHKEGLIES